MPSATDTTTELELRDYLAVLHRRRRLIVSITVAAVVITVAISMLQTPVYRSTAELLLRPRGAEQALSTNQAVENPQVARANAETEIQVMKSTSVRDAVADVLGFRPSVSIRVLGDTEVVAISAESSDAELAARIANTYAQTYVRTRRETLIAELLAATDQVQEQIDQLDAEQARLDQPSEALESRRLNYVEQLDQLQLSSQLASGGAQIVSSAEVPTTPVKPTLLRNALLAAVLGSMLAVSAAFLRDHLDDSIRTKEDLEKASGGTTLLGMVPLMPDWKDRHAAMLVSVASPKSAPAEAYRTLRTSLQFVGLERSTHITQITSPGPSDGKTTTLSNLGVALARAGQRVLMVDCDLRRPRLHEFFGVDNDTGFTSALLGTVPHTQAIRPVQADGHLALLPSGPPPANPAELLASARSEDLLRLVATNYDYVLIDGPPVLPVTDALVIARIADATVVVAAAGSTRKRDAARTFELLGQIDAPVIGMVLNDVSPRSSYDTTYGTYAYTYEHDAESRGRLRLDRARRRWSRRERATADAHAHAAHAREARNDDQPLPPTMSAATRSSTG